MWSRAYVSVGHLSICQSQHCSLNGRIYRSTAAALQWSHAASAALSAYVVAKHTHPFNGPFSRTTRISWYQKGKTNLDFTEARDCEWQWHQLGHMQVCISLQTDKHASTPPLSFYRPYALPVAQATVSKH